MYPRAAPELCILLHLANRPRLAVAAQSNVQLDEIPVIPDESDDEDESAIALNAELPQNQLLSRLTVFIPRNFNEAFDISRRHLWFPSMVKEIDRWDERGVVTTSSSSCRRQNYQNTLGLRRENRCAW